MSFAVTQISCVCVCARACVCVSYVGVCIGSLPPPQTSTRCLSLCDQVFTLEQGRNIFSHFYDLNRLEGGGDIRDRRGERTRDEAMRMTSQHRSRRNEKRTLDALYDLARC